MTASISTSSIKGIWPGSLKSEVKTMTLSGNQISNYLKELSSAIAIVFKEYPHLYEGTEQENIEYIEERYIKNPESMAWLSFIDRGFVGAAMGTSLLNAPERYLRPFIASQEKYDCSRIFYCGEFFIFKEYRGAGIREALIDSMKNYLLKQTQYDKICFCQIVRENHPDDYHILDHVWEKLGFEKHPELNTISHWTEIGSKEEIPHQMVYWIRDLK